MNVWRRSIFAIVIVLVILVTIFMFSQFLYIESWGVGWPSAYQLTATSIVAQNHVVETLISQTQTATAQTPTGTLTPIRP